MNISALALYLLGALLVDEVVQPEHSNPRREGPVLLLLVTTKEAVDALAPLGQLILIVLARVVPGPAVSARDCACCAAERVLDAKRPIVVDSADLRRPKSRGHARGVPVLDDLYVPRVLYVEGSTCNVLCARYNATHACFATFGRAHAVSAGRDDARVGGGRVGMPTTVCTGAQSATTVASATATVGPRCWRSSRHWVETLSPLGGTAPTRRIALFAKRQW